MKEIFRTYFIFNKAERIGLAGLILLIVTLLAVRICLQLYVPQHINTVEAQKLSAKWEAAKAQDNGQPLRMETRGVIESEQEDIPAGTHPQLFHFDPNTLDSAGFRKLGLREKTTSILLHWRAKGKVFYRKEELRKVYTLTEEEYQRLQPYINIEQHTPPLKSIDLNTVDSATLVSLRGIGPVLAHKIIAYRKEHGRFERHEQLMEIYHFPDSVFSRLRKELKI